MQEIQTPLPLISTGIPLTPLQWRVHEEQQRRIAGMTCKIDVRDRNRYWFSSYLLGVRKGRLWQGDPRYANMEFVDYVAALLHNRDWSRTTIERYLIIGEKYTQAEYQHLRRQGTSFTVLAEVQRLPEGLRKSVLRLAGHRRITREQLEIARRSGTALFAPAPSEEELDRALLKAIDKGSAPQQRKAGRDRGGQNGNGQNGTLTGTGPDAEALQQRQRELEKSQTALEEQQRECERQRESLRQQEARLLRESTEADRARQAHQAAQAEAEAAQRRVRDKEEALTRQMEAQDLRQRLLRESQAQGVEPNVLVEQEYAKIGNEREALKKDVAAIEGMRAEAQTLMDAAKERERQAAEREKQAEEREQRAEKNEQKAARAGQELAATLAALEAERKALEEKEAALQAERKAVDEQKAALETERTALQEQAARLIEKEEKLDDGLFQVELQRKDLAMERADLDATDRRIRSDLTFFARFAKQNFFFKWPDQPWNIEATLMCIIDHYDAVWRLLEHLETHLEKFKGFQGEPKDVLRNCVLIKDRLDKVPKETQRLSLAAGQEFVDRFPKQMDTAADEILREQAEEKAGKQVIEVIKLEGDRPTSRFTLPTAALLGNPRADSPVQMVLGTNEKGDLITVCMNGVQAIVIAGPQGSGKSNMVQGLMEALLCRDSIDNISCGAGDAAVVFCNFDDRPGAKPIPLENWLLPNDEPHGVQVLRDSYRARPRAMNPLRKIVYTPAFSEEDLAQARADYPQAEVRPPLFNFADLGAKGVRLFMAAGDNASFYMRKVDGILAALKDFTLSGFLRAIEEAQWTKNQKNLVLERVDQLLLFVHDGPGMGKDLRPGDLVMVDFRSPRVGASLAMTVFVCMMRAFSLARVETIDTEGNTRSRAFKKLFVLDEGQRYLGAAHGCRAEIVEGMRGMRHNEDTIVFVTQNPESVPAEMIRLATISILHSIKSIESLNYMARNFAAWATANQKALIKILATMGIGESRVLVTQCANIRYRTEPQVLNGRPTQSKPGGTTRMSIEDEAPAKTGPDGS